MAVQAVRGKCGKTAQPKIEDPACRIARINRRLGMLCSIEAEAMENPICQ